MVLFYHFLSADSMGGAEPVHFFHGFNTVFFAIHLALPASLWYSIMADLISKAASIKGALQHGAERGDRGDVPKWFKGPHSKCGRPGDRCVGSNPTISATKKHLRSRSRRCFCVFWGWGFRSYFQIFLCCTCPSSQFPHRFL